jgi:hypothetical protein
MTTTEEAVATEHGDHHEDAQYSEFLGSLRNKAAALQGPLFRTQLERGTLFDVFLKGLPEERRQHYTCNACKSFCNRHGGLVEVDSYGRTHSAMWDETIAPPMFREAIKEMRRLVEAVPISMFYVTSEKVWGIPESGGFHHMAITPDTALVYNENRLKNSSQYEAEKEEDFKMLSRSLGEFDLALAIRAHAELKSGRLYRSEKAIGVAEWFLTLHEAIKGKRGSVRTNLIRVAAATAVVGFCHLKAGVLGSLFEDLAKGLSPDLIKQRWDGKLNPLQYQRPQAPPSDGVIAQAEKIVAALQSAGALERRFARLDELQLMWSPTKVEPAKVEGVFGHLRQAATAMPYKIDVHPAITFEKFRRTVLPDAVKLEALIQHGTQPFVGMTSAVNMDAPPIIRWDDLEHRNPIGWYCYAGGSQASRWGMQVGTWATVTGITLLPAMWREGADHGNYGKGAFMLLDGCVDSDMRGSALFPELIKGEYREVRRVMEAHSNRTPLQGTEEASACGLDLRSVIGIVVRATDKRNTQTTYRIDRWD